ncbi:MAG: acetolactate synthase large subunit [Methanomassiliicoccales archaeon]
MRASDLLIRCLEAEGVERIFGIPGEETLEVMDSIKDSNIDFILTRSEASAALMAAACGRLSGNAQVCLSTLGPGATNLITGVAEAYLSYIPLIALTGQVSTEQAIPPRKQYLDLVQLFRPVTKESISVRSAARLPQIMSRAFQIALSEKPGPVMVELPEDQMRCQVDGKPIRRRVTRPSVCEPESLAQAREIISQAKKPLILAGPGTIRSLASEELRRFSRAWNIPVAHTWHGAGIMPFDDPLSLNTVGLRNMDLINPLFGEMDTVILLGYDVSEFQPNFWNFGVEKRVIFIGSQPLEAAHNLELELQLVGNVKHALMELSKNACAKRSWTVEYRAKLDSCFSEILKDEQGAVKPQLAVRAIRNALGREDICASDVGAHMIWLARIYPVYRENTLLLSNGLIPMGIGVPTAMGAKLTCPERKVVAVCGDGGFMMTMGELETAQRLNLSFVTIIFNDSGLGLIRQKQERRFGHHYGTDFGSPDWVRLAESFGVKGYRAESAKELEEILTSCLGREELAVIEVPIDYRENKLLM